MSEISIKLLSEKVDLRAVPNLSKVKLGHHYAVPIHSHQ